MKKFRRNEFRRKTVGQIAKELWYKTPDTYDPVELRSGKPEEDLLDGIYECIEENKKVFTGSFYVVVDIRKDTLYYDFDRAIRTRFTATLACPTPDFNRCYFFYDRPADHLEFLWALPSDDQCEYMRDHAKEIPDEEHDNLQFVLDYYDGTLLKKAMLRNGEDIKKDLPPVILVKDTDDR